MENKTIKRYTKEDFDNFDPTMKDMLCRLYYVCLKHNKEFTVENIITSSFLTSHSVDTKYAEIFLNNLDHIEELVKNQPTYTLKWDTLMTGDDGVPFLHNQSESFKCYDKETVEWQKKLKDDKNHYYKNVCIV